MFRVKIVGCIGAHPYANIKLKLEFQGPMDGSLLYN